MMTIFRADNRSWRLGLLLLPLLVGIAGPELAGRPLGPAQAAHVADILAADGTPAAGQPVVIELPTRPRAATPSGEQTLRLAGSRDDPVSLDPALANDQTTAFLARQVFRGLTRFDAELNPVPELAERIEISADGLVYTFRLRPTAAFHDERPITAADVIFSLTRALQPATAGGDRRLLGGPAFLDDIAGAAAVMSNLATELAGARALDEQTVELRLVAPRATFLMKLAAVPAAIVDPADVARGADWWQHPNGSGPFRLTSFRPGEAITLSAFAGFHAGPPPLNRVRIRLGPEAAQQFNLYQADAVDLAWVPGYAIDRVLDPHDPLHPELLVTPLLTTNFLAFRTDVAPMDDPHVRRAVQLAFPRRQLVEVGFEGHATVADGLIPPGMLGRDWPVAATGQDLAAARQELAAAASPPADIPPIRIYGAGTGGAATLRDVLAAELGLRVEVVAVESPEFFAGLARRDYPAVEVQWGADYPDPATFLWTLFAADGSDNYTDYRSDAFDALLRQAAGTIDLEARAKLYAQAQQRLIDDAVILPLYHDIGYTVAKPSVHGLEITPLGLLTLDDIWLEH